MGREVHTGSGAVFKSQVGDVWNNPLLKPKWRDTLGAKVTNAIVRDDSPVLEGKWPVRPSEFPIDPHHEKEANEAVEKWRAGGEVCIDMVQQDDIVNDDDVDAMMNDDTDC